MTVNVADASVGTADYQYITQKIEGMRCAELLFGGSSAKAITIQFGGKAPAGTYSVPF
ncbi:hypothetical protein [Bradyrhizobium sp. CCGB01]|uniref:hypothetical protein n=1 Tax=Bradyrhizobium sp. CCGB01 TaxID=2949634 RepID=UPI0020B21DB0|nr:hypothetical protein [Bradyrhizobium sp. CCGB01]MCP3405637.1 hypothetical protein [Bradyrhizobium sp. CCGB01]